MRVQFMVEDGYGIDYNLWRRCKLVDGKYPEWVEGGYVLGYEVYEIELDGIDNLGEIVINIGSQGYRAEEIEYFRDGNDKIANVMVWAPID